MTFHLWLKLIYVWSPPSQQTFVILHLNAGLISIGHWYRRRVHAEGSTGSKKSVFTATMCHCFSSFHSIMNICHLLFQRSGLEHCFNLHCLWISIQIILQELQAVIKREVDIFNQCNLCLAICGMLTRKRKKTGFINPTSPCPYKDIYTRSLTSICLYLVVWYVFRSCEVLKFITLQVN